LGIALSTASVLGRPPLPGALQACRGEDPPDGGAGEANPLSLRQQLREVAVVETFIGALGQLLNALSHLLGDPVG
jgi:hypothetical protein